MVVDDAAVVVGDVFVAVSDIFVAVSDIFVVVGDAFVVVGDVFVVGDVSVFVVIDVDVVVVVVIGGGDVVGDIFEVFSADDTAAFYTRNVNTPKFIRNLSERNPRIPMNIE